MESFGSTKGIPKGRQGKITRNLTASVNHWNRDSELGFVVKMT